MVVEHRIRSSDNSNHNIAAHNGLDALDCKDVQDAGVEEAVVRVEAQSRDHGAHAEEEGTELPASLT